MGPAAEPETTRPWNSRSDCRACRTCRTPIGWKGPCAAIRDFGCEAIVLDDAFQHRRIGRDLDLCVLDALEPFGYGHVFPRGALREPPEGLRRADAVILSRADDVPPDQRETIRQTVARLAPRAAWAEVVHAPQALCSARGKRDGPPRWQTIPWLPFVASAIPPDSGRL